MKTLQPMFSRVLLEAPFLGEREVDGIIIPAGEGEHLQDGHWMKCLAAGPDCRDVKKGDTVFLPRFSGHRVEVNGKPCILTVEQDVDAVLEK